MDDETALLDPNLYDWCAALRHLSEGPPASTFGLIPIPKAYHPKPTFAREKPPPKPEKPKAKPSTAKKAKKEIPKKTK